MKSGACRGKSHWRHASDAMRAARRYELRDCFVFQWYLCDECDEYHLRTRKHHGLRVLSLEALRAKRRARE